MPSECFNIGEISTMTGLSIYTLRYFEKENLLLQKPNRVSGKRKYRITDYEWLLLIKHLRDSGMSIAKIAELSSLIRAGKGNELQRLDILESHQHSIEQKITELEACREIISQKVKFYQQHILSESKQSAWGYI